MEPITTEFLEWLAEKGQHLIENQPSCLASIRCYFTDVAILRKWIDDLHFEVSPFFVDIIQSESGPVADDWKKIDTNLGYSKEHWAVYILVLEKYLKNIPPGESEIHILQKG